MNLWSLLVMVYGMYRKGLLRKSDCCMGTKKAKTRLHLCPAEPVYIQNSLISTFVILSLQSITSKLGS